MLQTAGTTVRSRRKLFNRLRSISPFSSPPFEAAYSDTHTVTDSFHGCWVYPSSPPFRFVSLLGYSYNQLTRLAPYWPFTLRRPRDFSTVAPLSYAQWSYCTPSVADVNALGSRVMYATLQRFIVAPAPLLFFFHRRLLWVSLVVITIIYFVGVYGKGFPVDSFPCIYLYFSFRPPSGRGISYFAWLVCGWSHTRETWVDGFFPGAGVEKN